MAPARGWRAGGNQATVGSTPAGRGLEPHGFRLGTGLGQVLSQYPIKFNIAHICIDQHKYIFSDIIRSVHGSLVDLGYECTISENSLAPDAVNIMVGSTIFLHRFPDLMEAVGKHPFVLYQLEQLDPDYGLARDLPAYAALMDAAAHIWEYSHVGLNYLRRSALGDKTSFVPPSFHRSLESFRPAEEPDIDVLFYGSMTERRIQMLDALRAEGVNVVTLFGAYGDLLRDHVRRAKIILNLHAWSGLSVLETVRLSYLLANRCFVVSEVADHNPYGDGVVYAEPDQLVETCKLYLGARADQRDAVAAAGYLAFRRSDMVTDLRRAIAELPIDRLIAGA